MFMCLYVLVTFVCEDRKGSSYHIMCILVILSKVVTFTLAGHDNGIALATKDVGRSVQLFCHTCDIET